MARHRQHLTHAPLREALVDIQFEPRVPLGVIDRFVSSLGGSFAKKQDLWEAFIGMGAGDEGQPAVSHSTQTVIGRRLELNDGPYVLQCRVSGFTLSRLSPYGEWEDLRSEARRLWEAFAALLGPVVVNRVAVRYINEIKLDLPFKEFGEYLTCPPQVPPALPQAISGFLTRVVIPDEANDCITVVTQALEGPPSEGGTGAFVTVILDIDVFRSVALRPENADDLWGGIEVLRNQKNRVFFEHLTETAVEMYE